MDNTILLSTYPPRHSFRCPRLPKSHPHAFYPSSQTPNKTPLQVVLLFLGLRHSNRRGVASCYTCQSVKALTHIKLATGALPTTGVSFAANVARPYRELIVVLQGQDCCRIQFLTLPKLKHSFLIGFPWKWVGPRNLSRTPW